MQPVRKVLSATHFREARCVLRSSENPHTDYHQVTVDGPDGPVKKLTPCSPGAPDAVEKTWTDVNSEELLEPLLGVKDFERSIQVNRPTVSQADIAKHIAFTNESGGDGV
jgi:vacuolar protein-sorting-associated protein 4